MSYSEGAEGFFKSYLQQGVVEMSPDIVIVDVSGIHFMYSSYFTNSGIILSIYICDQKDTIDFVSLVSYCILIAIVVEKERSRYVNVTQS